MTSNNRKRPLVDQTGNDRCKLQKVSTECQGNCNTTNSQANFTTKVDVNDSETLVFYRPRDPHTKRHLSRTSSSSSSSSNNFQDSQNDSVIFIKEVSTKKATCNPPNTLQRTKCKNSNEDEDRKKSDFLCNQQHMFSPGSCSDDGSGLLDPSPTNGSKKSYEQVSQDQSRTPPELGEPFSIAGSSLHGMKNANLMSLQRDKEKQKNNPHHVINSTSAKDSRLEGLLDEITSKFRAQLKGRVMQKYKEKPDEIAKFLSDAAKYILPDRSALGILLHLYKHIDTFHYERNILRASADLKTNIMENDSQRLD